MNSSEPLPADIGVPTNAATDLVERIRREPWRFEFQQVTRLLALDAAVRGAPMRDQLPAELRFRTPASLAFPPSEVLAAQRVIAEDSPENSEKNALALVVSFLGLTGPSGVLPSRYTELLVERKNNFRDTTLHDFLDIFSHRAIALFHAANQKYRFYRQLELNQREGFSRNLLDLVGAGLQGLRGRLALTHDPSEADRFLMYHAGILAQKPISATSLELLVKGLLGVDAKFAQFQGTYLELSEQHQSSLGKHNCTLGTDVVVGSTQYDCQTSATLAIGPLNSKAFADLLPGGSAANALRELMRFCVGHTLAIDVKLILQRDCVPAPHLSAQATTPKQLGFNTWIRTQPVACDRDDTRYALQL